MIAGHVHQHVYLATEAELRLTLLVCVCLYARAMVRRRVQVLWLIRVPMTISLASTRYAISVFFIRTTDIHAFPWLRIIGSRGHDHEF
jgi:hypothetical protein